MITFKSNADLKKLPSTDLSYPLVKELVELPINAYDTPEKPYRPEDDGYIVLIEERDTDGMLIEIWPDWSLMDIPWEGIMLEGGFFKAIFLANNEFGIVFVIPDAEWALSSLSLPTFYGLLY